MHWLQKLRTQLATLRRSRADGHLDAELRFHLDQEIAENLAAGMTAEEARRAATHSFGNLSTIREETRSTRSWTSVELFFRDLRVSPALRGSPSPLSS